MFSAKDYPTWFFPLSCSGCFIETACNYDSAVTIVNNDVCIFAIENCQICSGESDGSGTIIDIDTDGDGVPECDEITGCTDESACNYDSNPTTDTDNSLCEYADENFDCDGNCIIDVDYDFSKNKKRKWGFPQKSLNRTTFEAVDDRSRLIKHI